MNNNLNISYYYDKDSGTFTYLVADLTSRDCVVIDPVLGFDMYESRTSLEPVAPVIKKITQNNWNLVWILETHAHADHLTSAVQLKKQFNAKIAIGQGIIDIQNNFKSIYQFDENYDTQGAAFDRLLKEGDRIEFGEFLIDVIATPGHTSDSLTYRLDKWLFIGDTLFHPDIGSARCDFPGGNAEQLYQSIEKILQHDDDYTICLCHDYPDDDREPTPFITVGQMKKTNKHWQESAGQASKFKTIRDKRDAQLGLPKLIIPAIQVNTQAGIELNGPKIALKWPINRF